MDVRCSRCATEYEFDDALISERGTTVKCTNCGYQFKIYPGAGKGLAPERWVVRTASGRELVYTSLRELQRGIADKKVGANDLLSRGKQAPRPLGSIAELEPFFHVPTIKKPTDDVRAQRTLHGVAPPANSLGAHHSSFAPAPGPAAIAPTTPLAPEPRVATPLPPAEPLKVAPGPVVSEPPIPAAPTTQRLPQPPPPESPPVAADRAPDTEVMPRPAPTPLPAQAGPLSSTLEVPFSAELRSTLPGGSLASAFTAEQRALADAPVPAPVPIPISIPIPGRPASDSMPDSTRMSVAKAPISARYSLDTTLEVPRSPVSSPRNLPPIEVANIRDSFKSYDELQLDVPAEDHHARVARSRWIAGVVVVGVLGLLGATVGRRYLAQLTGAVEVKATSDARVAKFLSDGSKLADESDFESAKEEFDKATALAEKDPAVLTALARLETLRADVPWLKLRLLDPNSTDLVQATYRELGRRVGKARTAVDRAFAVSPEDPAVLRARVDSLRLSGDGEKAREWLGPLSANASVPENAYVLAALDLAEPNPVWPSAIDRLRSAAAAERDPGRARAALIYALVRANRVTEADSEFAKLDGRAKPHPLLEELRAFLKRAKQSTDGVGDAPPKIATVDTSKLPKLDISPAPEDEPRPATAAAAAPTDFRAKLAQASAALRSGDLARADLLFNAVLAQQPSNTEAMSGLGDVAKARRDPALAAKMYDRVLADNPSYLPAILASADQKWDSGDKPGALVLYHRLLEQAGPNSEYGSRAAARIAQGAGSPAVVETAAPIKPDVPATPPAGVDTTDLPGAR
ncbi:MAG: zinc-ribbon domain-containing protein [Polyangiaceae bacterium]